MDILKLILILFFAVFIHELGHFLLAKIFKMKVLEFGIGLPVFFAPNTKLKLFSWQETDITINPILLGGFVRFDNNDFYLHKAWQRILVQSGGAFFNFVLGFLAISTFFFVSGIPNENIVLIHRVFPNTPAYNILQEGDVILSANSEKISNIENFKKIINDSTGEILVKIDRNGQEKDVILLPIYDNELDKKVIGVSIKNPVVKADVKKTIIASLKYISDYIKKVLDIIGQRKIVENFSGIKTMYDLLPKESKTVSNTGQESNLLLWLSTLVFFSSINFSLMIINLLPFPGLDGGQIIMTVPEFFGLKIPTKYYLLINNIGVIFLMILIFLINLRDFF